ncbi:MAG: conjugative transposon protein TraM [Flavobacterium sp.]
MKENNNKSRVVRVTEGNVPKSADLQQDNAQSKSEKLKKPIIFALMGAVFLGCMYLIFKPSSDKSETVNIGLNDAVPQASDEAMPTDKGKAYEQEMLEEKNQEKRNALTTLSDYWTTEEKTDASDESPGDTVESESATDNPGNTAVNSYRSMQNTLGSFYHDNNSETMQLRKQLDELKDKLAEKDVPKPVTVDDQLALMEKSYQMAAKYLPTGIAAGETDNADAVTSGTNEKAHFIAFTPARKKVVSALYREATDSAFIANWSKSKNRGFTTASTLAQAPQPKKSIKACIHESQAVIGETVVRLRLLEIAKTPASTFPKGTLLTANAKFQNGRLQLKVSSIEFEGNIIPVDITVYDLDGQPGLNVPYSPEMNALTEMAGNMSQTGGTSVMLTQNAGQQVAADLSRGVVQGISGYFSKKVRTPKVTLKAGHQVFLVSKK